MNQTIQSPPKPGPGPSPSPASASRGSECGNCGSPRRWILHHVRIRGIHRRLCTSCVLRLHPSSFCPGCFQFYDSASVPPHSKRLTCSKCSSFTHSQCAANSNANANAAGAGSASASGSGGYLCPPCAAGAPGHAFFDIDVAPGRAIDKDMAKVLLCAAKISAASMSKAVVVARAEAERRVREAALARKRAREAIENLAIVVGGGGGGKGRKDGGGAEGGLNSSPAFNGFSAPPPPAAAGPSPSPSPALARKSLNGEAQAANGNGSERDKIVEFKKEKMEIEQQSQLK